MALGIRGFNPIWAEFDLSGKIFDDTYYMFVLQNTIPYIPAVVYHDPDLNTPWTNPIQFLGNGTLPNDIYFESEVVYRLEFRQGDTQADPLIYEVNNYVAGSGGSSPVDTVAFASSNQITNPQFALFNLESPTTISGTDPDDIELAPGWVLSVAGTGTVTINKVALNNANENPSNAPYALRLTLNGWTTDSVKLRQRFQQNGMLWANKIVSSTITARVEGSPQIIFATLIDSNSSVLGTVLPLTAVNEAWNEFTGYGDLPETTNPDIPPAAYIDYELSLPSNVDIYVTSFQLVVQELPIEPGFEQDSIERQIDHTYHAAYPIVPVGTVIDFGGFGTPLHYLKCDGATYSRTTKNLLFQALTTTETVNLTNTDATFTVVSADEYRIGMAIEGNGIPASTTISNIVGTTVTMSAAATLTVASSVRFFAVGAGAGDGSTTFSVYDLSDQVIAGTGGSLSDGKLGSQVGSATHTMTTAELVPHTHTTSVPSGAGGQVVTAGPNAINNVPQSVVSSNGPGSATPFSIVQQTTLMKKCIRFE